MIDGLSKWLHSVKSEYIALTATGGLTEQERDAIDEQTKAALKEALEQCALLKETLGK